ncbi:NAD(P)-dependent oxidoreductase [Lacticaseibacillus jixianensis]|uniref:NAD(P)-dependent oxidoreductase n=1 Tax=Lacticaseibacillus jixianensis TaxID=2486012 RepID=A0ABW4B739_9LACO|nr:NAD(P)-dependent oxidoreductase [Lacticaseibacillus jixianensis]
MNILTLFDLPDEAKGDFAAHPDWHVIAKAAYTADQAGVIDVILGWNQTGAAIIAGPNRVKFVQAMSAGVDYLPLAAFAKQGIQLANTSGIHAEPIASSTLAAVLAFARGLMPQARQWDNEARRAHMWLPAGQVAVVFGTGHIGRAIARRLNQQGMTVWGISRQGRPAEGFAKVGTDADALAFAAQATVLVNVMPLTQATHHFFDAKFFNALQGTPLFINVGRGQTTDTVALRNALHAGRLQGAALDVFEQEPLPAADPLWQEPQVLITPHVSGTVPHLRSAVYQIFKPNLEALVATGRIAQNQVDLTAGY